MRIDALKSIIKEKLDVAHVPDGEEQDAEDEESDHEGNTHDDELDITAPRAFGTRGTRERTPAKPFGYQLASSHICMTEDSE